MPGRDAKIYEEAAALWRQLYGEPPPAVADGTVILDLILNEQPATDYDRLSTPHLRRSNITFPRY
jgi:hypothetical protein